MSKHLQTTAGYVVSFERSGTTFKKISRFVCKMTFFPFLFFNFFLYHLFELYDRKVKISLWT